MKKAQEYKTRGYDVLVLDPLKNPDWPSELVFTDPNAFLNEVKNWRKCAIFVDEAGETIGKFAGEMMWLATRGRHYGHVCHFIAQRAKMVDVNVRSNCSVLNMFKQSVDDSKLLASEFAQPELKNGNTLQQGEFYYCNTFSDVTKYKIF